MTPPTKTDGDKSATLRLRDLDFAFCVGYTNTHLTEPHLPLHFVDKLAHIVSAAKIYGERVHRCVNARNYRKRLRAKDSSTRENEARKRMKYTTGDNK